MFLQEQSYSKRLYDDFSGVYLICNLIILLILSKSVFNVNIL
jgi:hypothetical protein